MSESETPAPAEVPNTTTEINDPEKVVINNPPPTQPDDEDEEDEE